MANDVRNGFKSELRGFLKIHEYEPQWVRERAAMGAAGTTEFLTRMSGLVNSEPKEIEGVSRTAFAALGAAVHTLTQHLGLKRGELIFWLDVIRADFMNTIHQAALELDADPMGYLHEEAIEEDKMFTLSDDFDQLMFRLVGPKKES